MLASVADWVAALPWFPFQGPFELIAGLTRTVGTMVLIALGVVAGFVVSLWAYGEMLKVVVTDTAHGYAWHASDPHAAAFSRWVKNAEAKLRDELAKIGVVVREEKKRQYWRRTDRSAG